MVPKFDDAAGFTLEHDDHAFSDLRCWNCHFKRIFLRNYFVTLQVRITT